MAQFSKNDSPSINFSSNAVIWISAVTLMWLFLWLAPWATWLGSGLWLKIGIGLLIFITPGTYLYAALSLGSIARIRSITSGFVLSHLLLAVFGLAGRIFHFPFAYVENAFMVSGLLFIALHTLWIKAPKTNLLTIQSLLSRILSFWPMLIIAGLAILMTIQRVITSDDLAYLAHLTNWQQMPNLNFSDVYFKTNAIESTRFWIVSTPFSQAFLADITQIPGLLLLSGYYEPFLAIISIFCLYELARILGLSHQSAMASVAVQVTFMALLSDYLHPGAPFFHQLSTDKATAAFIFTPVLISNAVRVLGKPDKGNTSNFLLSGLSLIFMHPIIAAYAVFIVVGIAILGMKRDNYQIRFAIIILALLCLTPQVGVRLVKHEAQPTIPTSGDNLEQARGLDDLISKIEGTPFYGFAPGILEMRIPYADRLPIPNYLLAWIWIIIPFITLLIILKRRISTYLEQYVLSVSLLIAIAGIPFTGWILGYFVSAWMLERTTWLYPLGISTIFIFLFIAEQTNLGKTASSWGIKFHKNLQFDLKSMAQVFIWATSITLILLTMREQGLPNIPRLESSTQRYQELMLIGEHIDKSTSIPVNAIGSDEINDFIPVLSWKAKVISYRPEDTSYPYFYTPEEKIVRWSDRQAIFSRDASPAEQMEIIQKYDIHFILLEAYRFGRVKDLISTYSTNFKVHPFGRYYLIEYIGF